MKVTIEFRRPRDEDRARALLGGSTSAPTRWVPGAMVYHDGEDETGRALQAIEVLVRQGIAFIFSPDCKRRR